MQDTRDGQVQQQFVSSGLPTSERAVRRDRVRGYGVAVACVAVVTAARFSLSPYLGGRSPYLLYLLATLVAANYGGLGPGLLCLGLGVYLAVSLFGPEMGPSNPSSYVQLGVFLIVSLLSLLLSVSQKRASAQLRNTLDNVRVTELALRDSEQRYASLIEVVPQLVWVTDADGKSEYFNHKWVSYTGATLQQTMEAGFNSFLHPDDVAVAIEAGREARRNQDLYEAELRIRHRDGTYHWFLSRGLPITDADGRILKWFGTCTDIDGQKHAEQAQRVLAELGEKLRPLDTPKQVLREVVRVLGEYLDVEHCNLTEIDRDLRIGLIREDFVDGSAAYDDTFSLDAFGAGITRSLEQGHTLAISDTQHDALTAAQYDETFEPAGIRAMIAVPLFKEGRWAACMGVQHSRPRSWTSEEVSLLEKAAEQTWLAVENSRLYEATEDLNARLRQSMTETHHRVKNNLQVIAAMIEIQVGDNRASVPATEFERLSRHIRTLAAMHDILTQKSKALSETETVSLKEVLEKLLPMLQQSAPGRSIRYALEDARVSSRKGTSLGLVVNEIVSNALKHSAGDVTVTFYEEGDSGVLEVCDDGLGFPPDFDPIREANTGLELIENLTRTDLRGTVVYLNRPDGGAEVRLVFPIPEMVYT